VLGSIVLWAIGISQDYLKGVTECNSGDPCTAAELELKAETPELPW